MHLIKYLFSFLPSGLIASDYFRHAHYQAGNTPLVLVWKDEHCSQYVLDTDSKGEVPDQQQVVVINPFGITFCHSISRWDLGGSQNKKKSVSGWELIFCDKSSCKL